MSDPQRPEDYSRYQPPQSPYQQPYQIQYQGTPGYTGTTMPGTVQAIGIMAIVDAVLSGLSGLVWMITICGIPLGIYSIAVAIVAGMYAYKLLRNPPQPVQPNRTLAIMQIVNIVTGNVISMVFGILSLVFYNQPDIQAYFAYRNAQPSPPHQYQPPSF